MANVKKQAKKKNTAKSKTDEQTPEFISYEPVIRYKIKATIFSILAFISFLITILGVVNGNGGGVIVFAVLTFIFTWWLIGTTLQIYFPNLRDNTKIIHRLE